MAKLERKTLVLSVLEDSGIPMKAVDVYRVCRLRGCTFCKRSTCRYLRELVDSGKVMHVDSDVLAEGGIVEVDNSSTGHYIASAVAEKYMAATTYSARP